MVVESVTPTGPISTAKPGQVVQQPSTTLYTLPPEEERVPQQQTNQQVQQQKEQDKSIALQENISIHANDPEQLNKGELNLSENQLEKTDKLRASLGLEPIEAEYPINETIYPKGKAVNVSENTLIKSDVLRTKLGLPPLEAVVPVNETIYGKAYDVTLYEGNAPKNYSVTLTEGQTPLPENKGGEAVSFLRFPFTANKGVSSNGIQSTTILDPLQFAVGLGTGVITKASEGLASLLARLPKTLLTNKIAYINVQINAEKIMKAYKTSENNLITNPPEKVGNSYLLSKGTVSESGIINYIPKEVPPEQYFINRLPSGKVEVIKPALLIPATIEVIGIGQTGSKTVETTPTDKELADRYPLFGQGHNDINDLTKGETFTQKPTTESKPTFGEVKITKPNEVTLTTKEGQSETPFGLINLEKGYTAIVRNEPQNVLPVNKVQLTVEGSSPEETALFGEYYNGKPLTELKNTFLIDLTPENVQKLSEGLAGNVLKQGTDIFVLPTEEFAKQPDLLLHMIRKPNLNQFKAINIISNISRPTVVRTMIARGITRNNLKPKPNTSKPIYTINDLMNTGQKIGAGAAGKAESLLRETTTTNKGLEVKTISKQNKNYNIARNGLGLSNQNEHLVFETLAFPPERNQKTSTRLNLKTESTLKINNKSSLDILGKLSTKQSNKQNTSLITQQSEITKQTTKQKLTTTQTTRQTTKTPPPSRTLIPPATPVGLLPEQLKSTKKRKKIPIKDLNFLGNASPADVVGLTKRSDITYGNKLTAKLTREDISKASHGSFIKNSISKPKKESKSLTHYSRITTSKRTKLKASKTKPPKITSQSKKLRI